MRRLPRLNGDPVVQLVGRYRIIEPIGEGAMAIVHRAHDPRIGRDIAVKILKELETSQYFDFVATATDVTRIIAPTAVTVPPNNKGTMKVAFQMAFPRGSEQDYTVSCDVGKPENCGRAIRLRAERLYRDYVEIGAGG